MKFTPDQRLAVAGLFLLAASVFAQISGPTDTEWLKIVLFVLAITLIIMGLLQLATRPSINLASFLPMCKERLHSAWSICARCAGHYVGFFLSAGLVFLIHGTEDFDRRIETTNPWWLLLIAVVLATPTAWHGTRRRLGHPDPLPHPAARVITGFMSGLAWYAAYLAFKSFFSD